MTRRRLARLGRAVILPMTAPAAPVRLRSPADVLALLEAEAARVRADHAADPVSRARAVSGIARVALDAIEADQLAARVSVRPELVADVALFGLHASSVPADLKAQLADEFQLKWRGTPAERLFGEYLKQNPLKGSNGRPPD